MDTYVTDMRIAGYSPTTITDRVELLERFRATLDKPILEATGDDIRAFQALFVDLAPASANIYGRHIKAFFDWASKRRLIVLNPADEMTIPRVPRGRPHPTPPEVMQLIFACATGSLRLAYVLAAFAGLRCGEICRLTRQDVTLYRDVSTAIVNGKGGKQRTVPLLQPVVDELESFGMPRSGFIVRRPNGRPYTPDCLSQASYVFVREIGVETTLHSMRHAFATNAARQTRDPLLCRDLLGHQSVATTEIYMESSLNDAHTRLAGVASMAEDLLSTRRAPLRMVGR